MRNLPNESADFDLRIFNHEYMEQLVNNATKNTERLYIEALQSKKSESLSALKCGIGIYMAITASSFLATVACVLSLPVGIVLTSFCAISTCALIYQYYKMENIAPSIA